MLGAGESRRVVGDRRLAGASVVLRTRFVVSAEGGGGREERVEARQRKHSPLPKYECEG